jgi:sterol 14-demethylase
MAEQRQLLDNDLSQDLVMEDVESMPEFDKVLNETLRLHPPFFQLARVTTKPTEYKGYAIPPGRMVSVSPGAAQRLPSLWGEKADEFDPTRWEPDAIKEHKKHAWIPFGGGRHQCSGESARLHVCASCVPPDPRAPTV